MARSFGIVMNELISGEVPFRQYSAATAASKASRPRGSVRASEGDEPGGRLLGKANGKAGDPSG